MQPLQLLLQIRLSFLQVVAQLGLDLTVLGLDLSNATSSTHAISASEGERERIVRAAQQPPFSRSGVLVVPFLWTWSRR